MTKQAFWTTVAVLAWLSIQPLPISGSAHLVEKIVWLRLNGGEGMKPLDVFDIFLHGGAAVGVVALLVGRSRLIREAPTPGAA